MEIQNLICFNKYDMKELKNILSIVIPTSAALFITYRLKKMEKRKRNTDFSHEEISNLVSGISSKEEMANLYKKLLIMVHPDRNPNRIELSEDYTTRLNNNRRNYTKLKQLALEIEEVF